jgi:pantothenate kinase
MAMSEQIALSLRPDMALARLEAETHKLLIRPGRSILGIAGGPGAGKSTIATKLVEALNVHDRGIAAYVPMDGFHIKHERLVTTGHVREKGAPHTFDVAKFETFLAKLKATHEPLSGPAYSRQIEDVVEDAYTVAPEVRLLVVEGNYLLLSSSPWWRIKPLIDLSVFLEVPRPLVEQRLLKRHAEAGLFTEERNRAHIASVDLPNYDLVARSKPRADIAITLLTET